MFFVCVGGESCVSVLGFSLSVFAAFWVAVRCVRCVLCFAGHKNLTKSKHLSIFRTNQIQGRDILLGNCADNAQNSRGGD